MQVTRLASLNLVAVLTGAIPWKSSLTFLTLKPDSNATRANLNLSHVSNTTRAWSNLSRSNSSTSIGAALANNKTSASKECDAKEMTTDMNSQFGGRIASTADCEWLCGNQGREAWCVHHQFSPVNHGTCKLYECVPKNAAASVGDEAVPFTLYSHETSEYCDDSPLFEGSTSGKDDCEAKCQYQCKYYSFWLSGGMKWCRTTATCDSLGEQPHTISIYKRNIYFVDAVRRTWNETWDAQADFLATQQEQFAVDLSGWMSEVQLLGMYGKTTAEAMIQHGFITVRQNPNEHGRIQYAANWMSEENWREMYDTTDVARLFALGRVKTREDPKNSSRTQYFVEGDPRLLVNSRE